MTKQTKILGGVLAGIALGAVVALVISSDKDSHMKSKIGDWVLRFIRQIKRQAS